MEVKRSTYLVIIIIQNHTVVETGRLLGAYDIYVVQQGDTIHSIAERYGVTVTKLIQDNGLDNPFDLVTGQTIVIAYPKQTYIVQEGDSLKSIADAYEVTIMQLLRNNPFLSDREYIYPEETLVISYNTIGSITTNGIAYPYINKETLAKVLPCLTYLSVFNYTATEKGEIQTYYDDSEIVQTAKNYDVIPLLMITTLTSQGEPNIEIAYDILLSNEYQDHHLNQVLDIMKNKGYYGVNLVINYINVINQSTYIKFIEKISKRMQLEGYLFFITLNQEIESVNNELLFEHIDYSKISQLVNGMLFIKLVWGNNYGPPGPVIHINNLSPFIDYVVSLVPSDNIILGNTTISYDWQLPYMPGISTTSSLTVASAIDLAKDVGATIQFDEASQTPYFLYNHITTGIPSEHIVWSIDARSIHAFYNLIRKYSLKGSGTWNVMTYFPQMWTIIISQNDIIKLLPANRLNSIFTK